MQFQTRRGNSQALMINVTSLIDVLFVLLLFLVASTTFKDKTAINLALPRSASADMAPEGPAVVVLTAGGETWLNDRQLPQAELRQALRQLQAATGEDRLVLRADTHSQHGDVVRLIDDARASGFTKVSLSAQRDEGTEERP
jgi:biopolymer transport protein ExbD